VRAPAVYGPGDRETLAYFRAVARGWALQPKVPDARLSLIHVIDLAEALALALDQRLPPSVYEIDDGHQGGRSYRDMADAAASALGRRARSLRISRGQLMAVARLNLLRQSLGGSSQILTPAKVNEMFHPDWTIRDRTLANMIRFTARYDLTEGFRHTVLWYRAQKWL
jgi:nucleoside-diphosphate-sugar epimerase